MKDLIYLDYAAATPVDPAVEKAMQPYLSDKFYNPSATYLAAKAVKKDLNEARSKVASILGARPTEIIFTSGATESNNMALKGVASSFPDGEILVSAIEHESVLTAAQNLNAKTIPVLASGVIDVAALQKMINHKTVLVSIMMVNNELGTIQPLREVAELIKQVRLERLKGKNKLPIYLHSDGAQAGNFLDLKVSRLGVDMMSINSGKIYGPKQSGAIYIKAGTSVQPQIVGGGQEFGLRSGTESVANAVGLARALELAQNSRNQELQRVHKLHKEFATKLQNAIPLSAVNGSKKHFSPHILSITFPGYDNERLMMQLDEAGIMVATGSACSASKDQASHVLSAIGLNENDARSTLRFSFGRKTDSEQLDSVVKLLAGIIGR